jgi:hypothetical protein
MSLFLTLTALTAKKSKIPFQTDNSLSHKTLFQFCYIYIYRDEQKSSIVVSGRENVDTGRESVFIRKLCLGKEI